MYKLNKDLINRYNTKSITINEITKEITSINAAIISNDAIPASKIV